MSIEYIIIGLRMKPLKQWHVPDLICLNAGVSLIIFLLGVKDYFGPDLRSCFYWFFNE